MKDYTRVPSVGQEASAMRIRVWNENLAAFFVTAPLAAPKPTIDAPVATSREGDAW